MKSDDCLTEPVRRLSYILILAAICFVTSAAESADEAVRRLDRALSLRQKYIELRQHTIDSLKRDFELKPNAAGLIAIGDAYSQFENDSALHYYEMASARAANLKDSVTAMLKYASHLPLAGLHEAAHKIYEATDTTRLGNE